MAIDEHFIFNNGTTTATTNSGNQKAFSLEGLLNVMRAIETLKLPKKQPKFIVSDFILPGKTVYMKLVKKEGFYTHEVTCNLSEADLIYVNRKDMENFTELKEKE